MIVLLFSSVAGVSGQVIDRPGSLRLPDGLPSLYDVPVSTLEGRPFDWTPLRGKKVLFVNVASECGYTYQYADLQKLQDTFGDKLVVVGMPSNQFGEQEPGSAEDIRGFCTREYNVTFPMLEKAEVKGEGRCALYRWLTDPARNGWNGKEPEWNFNKYLVDEKGELMAWFSSKVKPMDETMLSRLR